MGNINRQNVVSMLLRKKLIVLTAICLLAAFQINAVSKYRLINPNLSPLLQQDVYLNKTIGLKGTDIIFIGGFEPVPVLALSANPTNINIGGLTIITWTLDRDATSCVKSGDWSGSLTGGEVSNGSHSEVVDNINSTSVFGLQCLNVFGYSALKEVQVFVDNKSPPSVFLTSTPSNDSTFAILTWTLGNDAVYCQKSGMWSGTIQGNPTLSNTSFNQNIYSNGTYTLNCFNAYGSTTSSTTVSSIIVINPPILTLVANPVSVDSGESATLTWIIGNSPTSCTKSGDWIGAMLASDITNGEHTLLITNITESKIFKLECVNTAGSSGLKQTTVSVNGQDPNVWASCSGASAYILNGAEDRTIISTNTDVANDYHGKYSEIRGTGSNVPWPGLIGANVHLSINKGKYMSAKFTTDSIGYDAELVFSGVNAFQGPAPLAKTIAISTCPGDFSNTTMGGQEKCKSNSSSLLWSTKDNPGGPAGFFCELEKNTTYYLNIVHSDNSENNNYTTSDCVGNKDYCGMLFQYVSINF